MDINLSDFDLKGKPNKNLTDTKWQKYFRKLSLQTEKQNIASMNIKQPKIIINGYNGTKQFSYQGESQYYRYCGFINDILENIRSGKHDYCYFLYQISELLKFEHDRLQTKYLSDYQCFEVWLDNTSKIDKSIH